MAATHELLRHVRSELEESKSASQVLATSLRERDAQASENTRLLHSARRLAEEQEAEVARVKDLAAQREAVLVAEAERRHQAALDAHTRTPSSPVAAPCGECPKKDLRILEQESTTSGLRDIVRTLRDEVSTLIQDRDQIRTGASAGLEAATKSRDELAEVLRRERAEHLTTREQLQTVRQSHEEELTDLRIQIAEYQEWYSSLDRYGSPGHYPTGASAGGVTPATVSHQEQAFAHNTAKAPQDSPNHDSTPPQQTRPKEQLDEVETQASFRCEFQACHLGSPRALKVESGTQVVPPGSAAAARVASPPLLPVRQRRAGPEPRSRDLRQDAAHLTGASAGGVMRAGGEDPSETQTATFPDVLVEDWMKSSGSCSARSPT